MGDGRGRKEKTEISVSRGSRKLFYVSGENEDKLQGKRVVARYSVSANIEGGTRYGRQEGKRHSVKRLEP